MKKKNRKLVGSFIIALVLAVISTYLFFPGYGESESATETLKSIKPSAAMYLFFFFAVMYLVWAVILYIIWSFFESEK